MDGDVGTIRVQFYGVLAVLPDHPPPGVHDGTRPGSLRVQAVEARSSVRERLRGLGVDAKLGGIDRTTTVADARRMLDLTGADGLMVGRGAVGNPRLFAELQAALKSLPAESGSRVMIPSTGKNFPT